MSEHGKGDRPSPLQAMFARATRSQAPLQRLNASEAVARLALLAPEQSREALEVCRALSDFASAVLLRVDPNEPVLQVVASLRQDDFVPGTRVGRADGVFSKALESGTDGHWRAPLNLHGRASAIQELAVLRVCQGERLVALLAMTAPPLSELRSLDALRLVLPILALQLDRQEQHERDARRIERSLLLGRVARMLTQSLELDDLLQKAADAIHEILRFPNVDLPILDPLDPEVLIVKARGGAFKRAIQGEDRLSIHQGIMGAAVRERRVQWVNDLRGDHRYVQPPTAMRMRAELAIPIIWHEAVLGVLNVESPEPMQETDVELLQTVADDLASAICNARLFSEVQRLAQDSERNRIARQFPESVTPLLASLRLQLKHGYTSIRSHPLEAETSLSRGNELVHQIEAELTRWRQGIQASTDAPASDLIRLQGFPVALARMVRAMVPGDIGFAWDADTYRAQALMHEDLLLRLVPGQIAHWLTLPGLLRIQIDMRLLEESLHLRLSSRWLNTPGKQDVASMRKRIASIGGELEIETGADASHLIWHAEVPRRDRQ